MAKQRILVDERSWELAAHFLSNIDGYTETDIDELAAAIQMVCEDHCSKVEQRMRGAG